jgi:hypothetical protein
MKQSVFVNTIHGNNYVSLKIMRNATKGARITIGANGGIQYLGRMDQACKS